MGKAAILQRRPTAEWGRCLQEVLGATSRGTGRDLSGEATAREGKAVYIKIIT
ncbi:hypothetical protein [Acetobacterium wieringae]|uniref:hypothetical protein n=1 Tax=Acetobacterium wieringae TaxID=52694 RepID=UPI0026F20A86|nr:hypothetical protein [Acetobacterium wieringae]